MNNVEVYVDLYGLYFEEVVEYFEKVLFENSKEMWFVYVIIGIGYYSKNGKDKVGKVICNFFNEWWYVYCEFLVFGDCNNMGGILGIDVCSWDKLLVRLEVVVFMEDDVDSKEDGGVDIFS